jgi:hypothetical protein
MPEINALGEVQPDFDQAWVVGHEYIDQEGTTFWKKLREDHGYSREDVEAMSTGLCYLSIPEQALFEDYPGMPSVEHLVTLAAIYDTTPGALLDRCFEEKGKELIEERRQDEQ